MASRVSGLASSARTAKVWRLFRVRNKRHYAAPQVMPSKRAWHSKKPFLFKGLCCELTHAYAA
jgi:hypothetical protein